MIDVEHALDSVPQGLADILRGWCELVGSPAWRDSGDCPWWYGERASVSQLAGAAWQRGAWVMEEYSWVRGVEERRARIDLCVEGRGWRFIAEAKQVWPDLESRPATIRRKITTAMEQAEAQLAHVRADGYGRVAVVFVAPRTRACPTDDPPAFREKLGLLTEAMSGVEDAAVVAAFPEWAANLQSPVTRKFYAGVAVVARSRSFAR